MARWRERTSGTASRRPRSSTKSICASSKAERQLANRAHFLAVAARLMRRILVDFARAKRSQKRGGGAMRVTLVDDLAVSDEPGRDLVALDDALEGLAKHDERKSQVIEMRFFGGLSLDETAEALHISPDTVKRDWKLAKAWLLRELRGDTSRTE